MSRYSLMAAHGTMCVMMTKQMAPIMLELGGVGGMRMALKPRTSLKHAPLLRSLNPTHWPNCPLTTCYGNVGRGWNKKKSQDMLASKMLIDSDWQDCCESGDQIERHENTRTLRLGVQDAKWPLWSHLTFGFYRCIRIASYNLQIWRCQPSTEIAIDRQLLYPWAFQPWRTFGSTRFCGRSDVKGRGFRFNSGCNAPYFQFLYCLPLEFSGCIPTFSSKIRFQHGQVSFHATYFLNFESGEATFGPDSAKKHEL